MGAKARDTLVPETLRGARWDIPERTAHTTESFPFLPTNACAVTNNIHRIQKLNVLRMPLRHTYVTFCGSVLVCIKDITLQRILSEAKLQQNVTRYTMPVADYEQVP